MDVAQTWKAVLTELSLSISPVHFSTWIKPLSLVSLEPKNPDSLLTTLMCPSPYHQQILSERYQAQIMRSLERITGKQTEVTYIIGKDLTPTAGGESAPPSSLFAQEPAQSRPAGTHNLNPRLTFDTYIVGSSNNFAHAAAQGVANSPGTRYNPLFIYGGVGLGKTHLMHAIGHAIYHDHPDWNILYLSAETFVNDLINSLQIKKTASFKRKYRSVNVLMVDDIQFIAGKEAMQEEFFHTFNELYMSQRQIILTSDRPPQEISRLEERLSSRFMGGLMVDVQMPDFETRMAILSQKNKDLGLNIPTDILSLIAERPLSNIRELEGMLQNVVARSMALGGKATPEAVRELLGTSNEQRSRSLRPSRIIARTGEYFSYKPADIAGASRKAPLVRARHLAAYLLKTELHLPYERIGEVLGGRDHTTIMHGIEKVERELTTDAALGKMVADIKQLLGHE
jgi:chromosomal replication initiator protein